MLQLRPSHHQEDNFIANFKDNAITPHFSPKAQTLSKRWKKRFPLQKEIKEGSWSADIRHPYFDVHKSSWPSLDLCC